MLLISSRVRDYTCVVLHADRLGIDIPISSLYQSAILSIGGTFQVRLHPTSIVARY